MTVERDRPKVAVFLDGLGDVQARVAQGDLDHVTVVDVRVGADIAVIGAEIARIQMADGACREGQSECKQQSQDCYESAKVEPLTIESHCIPLESVLVLGRARRLL